MAQTSGWFSQGFGGHYDIRCEWSATQNRSANTSTIAVNLYLTADSGYYLDPSWGTRTVWISIDGNRATYSPPASRWTVPKGGRSLLQSRTRTISHNNNGTKTFNIGYYADIMLTLNGSLVRSRTRNRDYTLTPISRTPRFRVRAGGSWRSAKRLWVYSGGRFRESHNAWVRVGSSYRKAKY